MKHSILFTFLMLSSNFAAADIPADFWVNQDDKIVYIAPHSQLSVEIDLLKVSTQYWSQLNIEVDYHGNIDPEKIAQEFPGLAPQKVILSKDRNYHLKIAPLGIDKDVETSVSPNGPWFRYTKYLSEEETKTLTDALRVDPDAVSVSGNLVATVPLPSVVEHIELESGVCGRLAQGRSTVQGILNSYAEITHEIEAMTIKYDSTREMLKTSLLKSCAELQRPSAINSFDELLSLPLKQKPEGQKVFGETIRRVPSAQTIDLKYQKVVKLPEGPKS